MVAWVGDSSGYCSIKVDTVLMPYLSSTFEYASRVVAYLGEVFSARDSLNNDKLDCVLPISFSSSAKRSSVYRFLASRSFILESSTISGYLTSGTCFVLIFYT